MPDRPLTRFSGMAVAFAAVGGWELLTACGLLNYSYLPAPHQILGTIRSLVRGGELARDVAHTLGVALAAAAIASTVGTAAGLVLGLTPAAHRWLMASVDFARTIPAVALVPVTVLTFGPTATAELLLAVYAASWPAVLSTAAAVTAVHPRAYDVAATLHFDRLATLRKIVVPAAVPVWLAGIRVSVIIALLVTLVAEMVMYPRGLGGGLIESLNALAPQRMWAYALTCAVLGLVTGAVLRRALHRSLSHYGGAAAGHPIQSTPVAPIRGLLPIAVLLCVWQAASAADSAESLSFPPPVSWAAAIWGLQADGVLMPAIAQTLGTYLLGLCLATVAGTALGATTGASPRLDGALAPSFDFMAAIPAAVVVPLAALLLGPGAFSGIAVVAVAASWPILLNTAAAMRAVPSVRKDMSRTLGIGPVRRWCSVIVPSLTPQVMLGVRIASAPALIVALLADVFGTGTGLGRLLVVSQQSFDAAEAWGLLCIVGLFGYVTSSALTKLGRLLDPPTEPVARHVRGARHA